MDPKIGVFICEGCEIGSSIDIDKVKEHATGECKADFCATHKCYCSDEGLKTITDAIASEQLNKVVLGACSQRYFADKFIFGLDVFTERVNLREWVAWCHEPNDEDTQMLAEDYIAMGVAKARVVENPVGPEETTVKDILIIGGGVTGLQSALNVAKAGYKAVLIEKQDQLGGWAAKFHKVFPKSSPYRELQESPHAKLIEEVEGNSNIEIHKSTTIKTTKGQPGQFDVSLETGSGEKEIRVGAIIQATGWRQYPTDRLSHLGYGSSPNVITNIQMEEMAKDGKIELPQGGGAPKSVAFIQCAGSRDVDHVPYCSAVCCRVSLKQAKYIREKYPDCKVYIVYKDIRSPMQWELFYAQAQEDDGIFLTKGEVQKVGPNGSGINIDITETLLGEDIQINADMVVLATGMISTNKIGDEFDVNEPIADVVKTPEELEAEAKAAKEAGAGEKKSTDGKKAAAGAEAGAGILNLQYRQGTDLPTLKYGFPDSHYICFPYETRRTGIYAAGPVRAPMDISQSINDSYGASLKAIQCVEAVAVGKTVHPRSGDLSFPDFFMQRCTQCKRCTEECPFGTLDEDEKGTPLPNPLRCRRCGICFGACPERIINFKNYNILMGSRMIQSISMPEEFDEKPRILILVCENDAMPAVDMVGEMRMKYSPFVRFMPVRCIGSSNVIWLNDAFSGGFDGIMLLGCKKGDDYQCHFVRGSLLASIRMNNVKDKLKQLALESERVEIHEVQISDYKKIPQLIDDFVEAIETMGMNPFKDL